MWQAAPNAFLVENFVRTKISRIFTVNGSCGSRIALPEEAKNYNYNSDAAPGERGCAENSSRDVVLARGGGGA